MQYETKYAVMETALTSTRPLVAHAGGGKLRVRIEVDGVAQTIECERFDVVSVHSVARVAVPAVPAAVGLPRTPSGTEVRHIPQPPGQDACPCLPCRRDRGEVPR